MVFQRELFIISCITRKRFFCFVVCGFYVLSNIFIYYFFLSAVSSCFHVRKLICVLFCFLTSSNSEILVFLVCFLLFYTDWNYFTMLHLFYQTLINNFHYLLYRFVNDLKFIPNYQSYFLENSWAKHHHRLELNCSKNKNKNHFFLLPNVFFFNISTAYKL